MKLQVKYDYEMISYFQLDCYTVKFYISKDLSNEDMSICVNRNNHASDIMQI